MKGQDTFLVLGSANGYETAKDAIGETANCRNSQYINILGLCEKPFEAGERRRWRFIGRENRNGDFHHLYGEMLQKKLGEEDWRFFMYVGILGACSDRTFHFVEYDDETETAGAYRIMPYRPWENTGY